ncbi:UNVERIFIED_CONTAM: hypothetical protein Slati_3952100 [Sesamum latifolium]|uniref:DUF1421 domain-containing protein n=1 Tax=Sesamum latifolium TaxID=2727402 RepID=A0AAW2TNS2_9LAMI
MASGSSGRANSSGSKAFDFGSDDILCSYEDYGNQDGNNGIHSDPSSATNSTKEFNKSRMARSSVFPAATYSPPEESSFNQGVITTVENTMKKYTDNIMRFLEGISSRMSQLELYCYNLDKSIGEMRSDLLRDHGESESKLKSLEKHIQEVHRSVQILRDKQELADTQKELAKLQLAQKESSLSNNNQQNEDRASTPASEVKKSENSSDTHDQQLALALPHQVSPQPSIPARPLEHQQPSMAPPSSMPSQSMPQVQAYYLPPPQMSNIAASSQPSQTQYLPAQPQVQDLSRMPPPPTQPQVNQSPQVQSLPPYQQQWPPQVQQPVPSPQQPVMQPQIRTSSQVVYSSYLPNQPNQTPAEMVPNSMPMQVSFVGAPQPGSTGPEATYGYGSAGRPIQQQPPPQHLKPGYGSQSGEGYVPSGPRSALPPGNTYMVFDGEGGRTHHPPPQPHFQQNPYPPPQRMPSPNMVVPHSMRSHPYNELIEKLVGMGYRGDHIVGVIQRLEESGQTIDFNSVLDRLNGHPSGGSQRVWSS